MPRTLVIDDDRDLFHVCRVGLGYVVRTAGEGLAYMTKTFDNAGTRRPGGGPCSADKAV
jgi:hypothetical protein